MMLLPKIQSMIAASAVLALIFAPLAGQSASKVQVDPGQSKSGKSGKSGKTSKRVLPSAAARAALNSAGALRAKAKGTKGTDRAGILRSAALAYQQVAADFSAEPAGAAAACFAAGELWRVLRELQKSSACFVRADELDPSRYHTRSTMNLAHIARQQKSATKALSLYGEVATLEGGSSRGVEARLWVARLWTSLGDPEKSASAYRQALKVATTPRQKMDVCNRFANHLVKAGDLEGAEVLVQKAKSASEISGSGKPETVERVLRRQASAFAQMSSRRALRRARDKANKVHLDALRVEKSKR
jgi:tetratricopeptide (TPR) repeat protein